MAYKGISVAERNKAVRLTALKNDLAGRGLIQHVTDIANKLQDLNKNDLDSVQVQRLKAAADLQLKLINKYMPDAVVAQTSDGSCGIQVIIQRDKVSIQADGHTLDVSDTEAVQAVIEGSSGASLDD